MRYPRLLTNSLAAIFCFLFVYATSRDGQESPRAGQGPTAIDAAWGDFSREERIELIREVLTRPCVDHLERSAVCFVEEEGFLPTEIMGPVKLDPEGREQLVAFREGKMYALDLPGAGTPVFPGLYWTSGMGSAWTLLLPDGEEKTYWVQREL